MIILHADVLARQDGRARGFPLRLRRMDDGDAYSSIGADDAADAVPGTVYLSNGHAGPSVTEFGMPPDEVRVVVCPPGAPGHGGAADASARGRWHADGHVRRGDRWETVPVQVVSVCQELAARTRGLFETGVLADKCVFTAGMGSIGSGVVLELARSAVGHHILMDHDRVETGNVVRHVAGLRDVGRRKTRVMADVVRDKNPAATVETCDRKVSWDTRNLVAEFAARSDLVICAADSREARIILNLVCLEQSKVLILTGASHRAYGGQVFIVRPGSGPCYQCFLMALSSEDRHRHAMRAAWAEPVAYSDRPAAIEPGLSNDLAPISQVAVKLAIQHLLRGQPTTLRSLDEDLVAPWYLWLNRREAHTDYERLEPLRFHIDGMHILRWYGVAMGRNNACPACGDYVGAASRAEGFELGPHEMDVFGNDRSV